MKHSRRHHSSELKREAVAFVVEPGYSCAAAGRSLGVSGTLVRRWKVELGGQKGEAFPGNGHRPAEPQRIHALETENRRLWMERDIVKKGIREIFSTHRQRYGAPRMAEALHEAGIACSENRVARRMRALGLQAIQAKTFQGTTDSTHAKPVAPDLIELDFRPGAPNQKWTSDISYIWTDEGWRYLAVVMDLYARAIVGWSMARRMTQQLVCDALIMALCRCGFPTHTQLFTLIVVANIVYIAISN